MKYAVHVVIVQIVLLMGADSSEISLQSAWKGLTHHWKLYIAMPVEYDIVHMRDKAFLKQHLNKFGSLPKTSFRACFSQWKCHP